MTGVVNIELSELDARLFKEFQRMHETICVLDNAGVFNIRNGKATLNFNEDGVLTDIDTIVKTYKRKKFSTATPNT